jgi:Family of unknown function (DUF6152)
MKIQTLPRVVPLVAAFLMLGAVVSAHHSAAHYSKQAMTSRGVVVEYRWRNPHVYVVWEVKGKSGEITHWVGELSSVTTMISDGMTKDSLKQGEEIEVIACPSMNPGSTEAWIRTIKKADGKVVVDSSRGACTLNTN